MSILKQIHYRLSKHLLQKPTLVLLGLSLYDLLGALLLYHFYEAIPILQVGEGEVGLRDQTVLVNLFLSRQ